MSQPFEVYMVFVDAENPDAPQTQETLSFPSANREAVRAVFLDAIRRGANAEQLRQELEALRVVEVKAE